jgi:hypothetical protein
MPTVKETFEAIQAQCTAGPCSYIVVFYTRKREIQCPECESVVPGLTFDIIRVWRSKLDKTELDIANKLEEFNLSPYSLRRLCNARLPKYLIIYSNYEHWIKQKFS